MHTITVRIAIKDGHGHAGEQETHDLITGEIEQIDGVASATIVEFSTGQETPEPGGVSPE